MMNPMLIFCGRSIWREDSYVNRIWPKYDFSQ